ncbi:MAG: KH domain-containing protein [Clostridia bacterium]|nr:KH domain-containing protein [Clostridia bacterium]
MKKIEVTAKNVQKAIEQGLKELNVTQDQVDIKIIDEGGFFKKAKVELILDKEVEEQMLKEEAKKEVTKEEVKEPKAQKEKTEKKAKKEEVEKQKETKEEDKSDMFEFGTNFLKGLFAKMNVEAEITSFEADGCVTFNASGEKVSTLIGKRGETLNAIQDILANVMKNANFRDKKFYFDVENYKNRREISLINLAERMAKKALKIEKPIKLERMNAYERKIIHTALQSCEGITTKSEGEEPNRHLVIIPTKKDEE